MTEICRYIDDPITFLFWEIDEAIAISSCLFIGILTHTLITMIFVGAVLSYTLKKIKKRNSEGVMLHFLYWHGFFRLRNCPASYIRELIGQ